MAVSNALTAVIPTLFAQGLRALRSNCVMPRLVNNDFGTEVKQKGDTISVPIPSAISATDVVPGAFAPDSGNVTPTTATIPLSNWKEAPFTLSEKELANAINGVVPMQLSAAVEGLATTINSSILSLYNGVYGYAGTAGTTPFASDFTTATAARKVLAVQKVPTNNRRIVLGPDAEANAVALPAFYSQYVTGDNRTIVEGEIGRKLGFDWWMDQQVLTHTSGTITTGLIAKAATVQAVGAKAITCTTAASTGACALKAGDIILFSGDTQTYAVTADATQASASTDVVVNISPGKMVALAGSETITVKASHVVNMAFHRDCFAFASRPLTDERLGADGDDVMMVPDPVTGLTMRLMVREEFHRTRWAFDVLWGVGLIRPELGCRIAG